MAEYRPSNGSCARCRSALDFASVRVEEKWYCRPACAEGRPDPGWRPSLPERRLYGVPRRFFRARKPKELHATRSRV